jgi:hypothetical protein
MRQIGAEKAPQETNAEISVQEILMLSECVDAQGNLL